METESQADFARRHAVSRKTVTLWKQGGLVIMATPKRIDIEASNKNLEARSRTTRRGIVRRERERAISAAKRGGVALTALRDFDEGALQGISLFASQLGPLIAASMIEAGVAPLQAYLSSEIIAGEVEALASDVLELQLAIPALASGDARFPLHSPVPIPWAALSAHSGIPMAWAAVPTQRAALTYWGRKESLPLWRRLKTGKQS